MPLNIPKKSAEVVARAKADVQRELNQSNPFFKNNWLGAIVTAAADRIFDFYIQLEIALLESFPDTATGSRLVRWAATWGKQAKPASQSNGNLIATGAAGSVIPLNTTLSVAGVGEFRTTSAATISEQTIEINDLTRSGQIATAVTASDHGLANGLNVIIAGAADSDYNITAEITVTGADAFQYTVAGSPADEIGTPATASFTAGSVPILSDGYGGDQSLDAGTKISLQSPIIGVDDTLTVDYGAIGGGTDAESEDSLRGRMQDRIQNPVANFNVAAITEKAKDIAGVTRVFVQEITPEVGQFTVYFMRDNDPDPIPTGSEVNKVKDNILTIKPANSADVDVIVSAAAGQPADFTFTALTPNTSTMKAAINANLRQFFNERTEVGVGIDEDAYRAAIYNTIDTTTGQLVSTFTLSSPVGDIAINSGEIGTLGAVVYT